MSSWYNSPLFKLRYLHICKTQSLYSRPPDRDTCTSTQLQLCNFAHSHTTRSIFVITCMCPYHYVPRYPLNIKPYNCYTHNRRHAYRAITVLVFWAATVSTCFLPRGGDISSSMSILVTISQTTVAAWWIIWSFILAAVAQDAWRFLVRAPSPVVT